MQIMVLENTQRIEALLRGLVEQIERGEYSDENGHHLKMDAAFTAAQAWLSDRGRESLPYAHRLSTAKLAAPSAAAARSEIARILNRKS